MALRSKLIVGNWKMNGSREESGTLASDLARRASAAGGVLGCELVVCPPAPLLGTVADGLAGSGIALGGQDCHAAPKGPHTGDISAEMLTDLGCRYVILGHSERRQGHDETDAVIRGKIAGAWRAGLVAILCVGETQEQREAGHATSVVSRQLTGSIPDGAESGLLVVAYEPIWAIGTGLTATADDICAMHAAIRGRIPADIRILYGGSVNRNNASAILRLAEVNGALVGGASLNADDFWSIARACD